MYQENYNLTNENEKGNNTMENTKQHNNAFSELLRNYEKQARQRTPQTETEYTQALTELATACTYSVLKKLCMIGGTVTEQTKNISDTARTARELRQSIARDSSNLKRLQYAINNATEYTYNKDGEIQQTIVDSALNQSIQSLLSYSLDDGIDLIQTAIEKILSETAKTQDVNIDFMEKPYTVRRLKRKVYIKDENSANGYETVNTTPIQEVYKAIRRDIAKSRAIQTASHKYTYLETLIKDSETDVEMEVYKRLPKYSGLAYEMVDINGKIIAITANNTQYENVLEYAEDMNLTAKQAKILQLRLSGYGYKAIGTYLGISHGNVQNHLKAIQKKAKNISTLYEKMIELGLIDE